MPGARHPHFNDRRAIDWRTTLSDAVADARAENRRVLIVYGGPKCEGTRTLVERTIWKDEVAGFLNERFIAAAIDPGADPDVEALLPALPRREPTPLCIYLIVETPDTPPRVVHSTAGARPPAVLINDMVEASARK